MVLLQRPSLPLFGVAPDCLSLLDQVTILSCTKMIFPCPLLSTYLLWFPTARQFKPSS